MRLLTRGPKGKLCFAKASRGPVRYAILSHTWLDNKNQEVKFKDFRGNRSRLKRKAAGYEKVAFTMKQAEKDNLQYCWVDTCCINRKDPAEYAAALKSMFDWYRQSEICYVLLSDVSTSKSATKKKKLEDQIRDSRWFTRGWTLQELVAPKTVKFFSSDKKYLGDKIGLIDLISKITKIPQEVLREPDRLKEIGIAKKFYWSAGRQTFAPEDKAYCLLGILGVDIEIIPGQEATAFARVLDAIYRKDKDPRRDYTLPYDPTVWPSASPVSLLDGIQHKRLEADDPLFQKTQAELDNNIKLATFLTDHYNYTPAEELYLLTLADARGGGGELQAYVNWVYRRLGNMYEDQHRSNEAKKAYFQATLKKNGGQIETSFLDETDTCTGIIFPETDTCTDAQEAELTKAILQENDKEIQPSSLYETCNNLGTVFLRLDKLEEAEKYTSFAAVAREKLAKAASEKWGENHPSVIDARRKWARSVNNLGAIHSNQGKLADAECKLQQALAIVHETSQPWQLGLEKLQTQINLGRLLMKAREGESQEERRARDQQAKDAFEEGISAWADKAKEEWEGGGDFALTLHQNTHPSCLLAVEYMAQAFGRLGAHEDAHFYFQRAWSGHRKTGRINICGTTRSWVIFLLNRDFFEKAQTVITMAKEALRAKEPHHQEGIEELELLENQVNQHFEQYKPDRGGDEIEDI